MLESNNAPLRIVRKRELLNRIGYSEMQIWRLERAGKFPQRIQLGPNSVGWIEGEVEAWIKQRAAERNKASGQWDFFDNLNE